MMVDPWHQAWGFGRTRRCDAGVGGSERNVANGNDGKLSFGYAGRGSDILLGG